MPAEDRRAVAHRVTASPAPPVTRQDLPHEADGPAGGAVPEQGGVEGAGSDHVWARIGFVAGPTLFLLALILPAPAGLPPSGQRVGAVALLMAVWWMTEAIPLAATSLLPIALFPALGIMSARDATAPFADDIIYLFLGGFCIALAMQRWGLHRRIALAVVQRVGTEPRLIVLGFMLATAFLSAWMSNTATTMMMLPIGVAVLEVLERDRPGDLGTALTLGIAYAASIGGIATLIGTPPNAVFAAAAERLTGRTIGFLQWMYVGVPVSLIMLAVTWWLLVHTVFRLSPGAGDREAAGVLIRRERTNLGSMRPGEIATAVVFTLTALGWILREPKQLGDVTLPGITSLFPDVRDSTVAVAGAMALFILPVSLRRRTFVLNWEWAAKIPWGILLLIGGGLALANGFTESGLSAWIGEQVTMFRGVPVIVLLGIVAVIFCALTELTSNTATTTLAMPIMAGVAAGIGTDPLLLMGAAALAASSAYMLPVATPPNAIVFATGRITMAQMIRAGFRMEIISVIVVTLIVYFLFAAVFGIAT